MQFRNHTLPIQVISTLSRLLVLTSTPPELRLSFLVVGLLGTNTNFGGILLAFKLFAVVSKSFLRCIGRSNAEFLVVSYFRSEYHAAILLLRIKDPLCPPLVFSRSKNASK